MGAIADMTIETYAMESAVLRTQKLVEAKGEKNAELADRHDARLPDAGHGEDRSRPPSKSSRTLRKATCCARSWRFCAGWQSMSRSTTIELRQQNCESVRLRLESTRWRKDQIHHGRTKMNQTSSSAT